MRSSRASSSPGVAVHPGVDEVSKLKIHLIKFSPCLGCLVIIGVLHIKVGHQTIGKIFHGSCHGVVADVSVAPKVIVLCIVVTSIKTFLKLGPDLIETKQMERMAKLMNSDVHVRVQVSTEHLPQYYNPQDHQV